MDNTPNNTTVEARSQSEPEHPNVGEIEEKPANIEEMTNASDHEQENPIEEKQIVNETIETSQKTSCEEEDAKRYASLIKVTKKVKAQLPQLDDLSVDNIEPILSKFRETFEEALHVSEKHAQAYIAQAEVIENALAVLGEYNRKVLEQLSKITVDTVKSLDDPAFISDHDRLKLSELLVARAKQLVETAEKQVQYSKHIGSVAKPLTTWRLDASKAVWDASNALKLAENKHAEIKERSQPGKTVRRLTSRLVSEKSSSAHVEPVTAPLPTKTKKEPIIKISSFGPSFRTSTKTPMSDSEALDASTDTDVNSVHPSASEAGPAPRQPIKFWPKHVYKDSSGEVICYIRAPSDCLLRKNHVTCTFSDVFAPWPPIHGHTEAIGRYVSIHPIQKYKNVILKNEPWIIGIPHTFSKVPSKEAVIYMIEADSKGIPALEDEAGKTSEIPSWRDLTTTDVVVDDTHYLEARLTRLTDVTFAPFARLRRDRAEIGRLGGELMCIGDPRISLNVPNDALKVTIPFAIQVQQLDRVQLPILIERNDVVMGNVIASSPLIYLTCAKKTPFKPISISLPVLDLVTPLTPSISTGILYQPDMDRQTDSIGEDGSASFTGKTPTGMQYDDFQKSLVLRQLLAETRPDVFEVVLMRKLEKVEDKWSIFPEAERVDVKGEVATFDLKKVQNCRLLALKLRRKVDEEILAQCASILEQSVSQHMVYIAVRQHFKQPEQLCLILALKDTLENALQQISEEGYKDGDKPFGPVFLTENQHVDISFKSNIRLSKTSDRKATESSRTAKITFNSAVVNKHKFIVKVVDTSAQLGLDHYRGLMNLSCKRNIVVPLGSFPRAPSRQSESYRTSTFLRLRKARFRTISEQSQLANIVIKLPKEQNQTIGLDRTRSFRFEPKDAVTPKYLKDLATKLSGDSWRRLGVALDIPKSRVLAMSGKASGTDWGAAHAMLLNWVKNLPLNASRFSILHRALQSIGRQDLAAELCAVAGEYSDEYEDA